jgi:hypothetical protein
MNTVDYRQAVQEKQGPSRGVVINHDFQNCFNERRDGLRSIHKMNLLFLSSGDHDIKMVLTNELETTRSIDPMVLNSR